MSENNGVKQEASGLGTIKCECGNVFQAAPGKWNIQHSYNFVSLLSVHDPIQCLCGKRYAPALSKFEAMFGFVELPEEKLPLVVLAEPGVKLPDPPNKGN